MTDQQIKEFRTEFKSIVYAKGLITEHNKYISKLHIWDKNGSHHSAISKALETKK